MQSRKISPVAQKALDHYAHAVTNLVATSENASLNAIRQTALQQLQARAFPTQRDEDWQYTRLTGFLQNHFSSKPAGAVSKEQVQALLPSFAVTKLVFVDGWFSESLSDDLSVLPASTTIETFVDVVEDGGNVDTLFAHEDEVLKEPFGVLNSCLASDGFYLQMQANAHLELPIYVLYIQTENNQAINLRNRVELGENAELHLVERMVSLQASADEASLTNIVTSMEVAKSGRLHQVIMQEQNDLAFYFNNQFVMQAEQSQFNQFFASQGSQLARHQNHLWMNGEHIESQQNSACLAKAKQVVDSRTDTKHNQVYGLSQQLHKYVLTDQATGVFNGMIRVDQQAQKTDGQMDNKNLLLSNQAKMDTKPQLEIYADDVKCSHGSATGQIDENQIFYLQARGISRAQAIQMITHAFVLEPVEDIAKPEIRDWIMSRLAVGLESIHQ